MGLESKWTGTEMVLVSALVVTQSGSKAVRTLYPNTEESTGYLVEPPEKVYKIRCRIATGDLYRQHFSSYS
jgi:hypothetical protein